MADILKHLDLNSADGTQLNLDALYQVAPSAFTEVRDDKTGEISRKVNFEVLRRLLGDHATDGDGEMYQFTWVGKNAARAEAAKPTDKTLRPVVEDSVDWDNTKNIYVEGDNLEVLKLLQRSYMGKVKMIYIDPPYNTGNDFVYEDNEGAIILRIRVTKTKRCEDFPISKEALKWLPERIGSGDEKIFKLPKNDNSNRKLKHWCTLAGITKNVTFHVARHTAATLNLSLGVPIETVSKLLGHTKISTTQIYAKVIDANKKAAVHKQDGVFD